MYHVSTSTYLLTIKIVMTSKTIALMFFLIFSPLMETKSVTKVDPIFEEMVQKLVSEKKLEGLCEINKELQNLLTKVKNEHDRKSTENSLAFLKETTDNLKNLGCQIPVITKLPTTTTVAAAPLMEHTASENALPDVDQELSLCDECEVDYEKVDIARDNFTQILKEGENGKSGIERGISSKMMALFSVVGFFGLVMLVLFIFVCVKKYTN